MPSIFLTVTFFRRKKRTLEAEKRNDSSRTFRDLQKWKKKKINKFVNNRGESSARVARHNCEITNCLAHKEDIDKRPGVHVRYAHSREFPWSTQWETGSKKGATGWRPSSGSHLKPPPLLPLPFPSISVREIVLVSRRRGRIGHRASETFINSVRGEKNISRKYLIGPVVLRATIQIRHQGVLPHFPVVLRATVHIRHQGVLPYSPEGHRHSFSHGRRDENGALPRCCTARGYRVSIEIPTPSDKYPGQYLTATIFSRFIIAITNLSFARCDFLISVRRCCATLLAAIIDFGVRGVSSNPYRNSDNGR